MHRVIAALLPARAELAAYMAPARRAPEHPRRHDAHLMAVRQPTTAPQITLTTISDFTVHPPTAAGSYAHRFGWTVKTPQGGVAYSGNQRGATAYAQAMNSRTDLR